MKHKTTVYKPITFFLLPLLSFSLMGCGGDSAKSVPTIPDKTPSVVVQNEQNSTKLLPWEHGNLKVKDTMLQHEDGTGFFWMADTAWELYMKSKKDIDLYLTDRAEKKFTVIQSVAMHSHWTNRVGGVTGIYPYTGQKKPNDLDATPNERYWKHIDYMISKAEEKGLYVALLPFWHHAIVNGTFENPAAATKFGKWIANRYKDRKNIIWVVGGDTTVDGSRAAKLGKEVEIAIWNALGTAINSVDSSHLITFHPLGTIPSVIFSNPKWLDFNMLQSGRGSTSNSVEQVSVALNKGLAVVDGESLYENFALVKKGGEKDRRTPYQIRDDAYSQIFAGAFGNTYGHDSVFAFWESTEPAKNDNDNWARTPNMTWKQALDAPGARQMQYVTELMQSRPIVGRKPDQTLIVGNPSATAQSGIVATKGSGYAMIYTSHGEDINVQLGKVSGSELKAWWYNPKDGTVTSIGEFENSGTHIFKTPGEPTTKPADAKSSVRSGNDWILVLDDKSKGYGKPGE